MLDALIRVAVVYDTRQQIEIRSLVRGQLLASIAKHRDERITESCGNSATATRPSNIDARRDYGLALFVGEHPDGS